MLDLKKELGEWYPLVENAFPQEYWDHIGQKLNADAKILQPEPSKIFRAFQLTPPHKVKVVIIGQDPYPLGHADGLAFSSCKVPAPSSLKVIYDELEREGYTPRTVATLDDWAEQGVLLMNTTLTTVEKFVGAHVYLGWQQFTGHILQEVYAYVKWPVFMVWGSHAREQFETYTKLTYKELDELAKHDVYPSPLVLKAPHPQAQHHGYNFLGCGHFKKCNDFLEQHNKTPIKWSNA